MNRELLEECPFFIGTEVENLPSKGEKTLFVVDWQDPERILEEARANRCRSIYLGANQSFTASISTVDAWEKLIAALLDDDDSFWVVLDVDVSIVDLITGMPFMDHPNFIPVVSVKMPDIRAMSYNTVVKIDDVDFNATNPGVWVHPLSELTTPATFTHWQDYRDDRPV